MTQVKTALPEAGLCNNTALRKATRRVSLLYDAVLAPCGLRSTQRSILIHISRAGAPTIGELANALVLDRSALTHNLKPLIRDGFVQLLVDECDKRSRFVSLTAAGTAKLIESTHLWAAAQTNFERVFGPQRAKALRDSLDLIASPAFVRGFQQTSTESKGALRRPQ